MDYNRLKNRIIATYKEVQIFFDKEGIDLKLTEGGFYQAIRNDSLKIRSLEKISEKTDTPMSYWWNEAEDYSKKEIETKREIEFKYEDKSPVNSVLKKENEKLKRTITIQERTIEHLNVMIDGLREKLNEKSSNSKAAG